MEGIYTQINVIFLRHVTAAATTQKRKICFDEGSRLKDLFYSTHFIFGDLSTMENYYNQKAEKDKIIHNFF